jgi:acetylornithine deacetylase/succinyl-diaminopimelate desuccinylase family protein
MTIEAIQLLRDMIAIPSVNPMRAGSGLAVERELVEYVESTLRRAGIDCERQAVAEGRDNVVAVIHASGTASRDTHDGLMFNSHLDTVPVANMTIEPFDPVVRDGRIYGRGACDAKGSIAAMIATLVAHANSPERPVPVVFAAMADEEFSFGGSWKLIERDWPVNGCVVGEPTKLASIIAHKGIARWLISVTGTSAHGAMPQLGHSAIYDGARIALALEAYAQELARRPPHPLLGRPTINVGRVTGGNAVNVVPDSCEFEVERRLLPGEDGRQAVRDCEEWVRERVGGEIRLSVNEPYLVDPALDTPREASVVRAVGDAHLSEFGSASAIEGAHYCTDGSKLASAGIETVVCGPGDIAQAHTCDEFIKIEQVEKAVRLYSRLVARWPLTLRNAPGNNC